MNAKDLKPIHRQLVNRLRDFGSHKSFLLVTPLCGLLRAIDFGPSAFSKEDFHLATLVMPLCVPTDHISLLFGDRIRHPGTGGWGWSRDMPNLIDDLTEAIQSTALPFLESVRSADDFFRVAAGVWRNPHAPKAAAFVLARAGQCGRAVSVIDELLPKLDLSSHWQKGIFEDTTNLRHLLLTDPDEAQRKLAGWEDYTTEKLGLQAFR